MRKLAQILLATALIIALVSGLILTSCAPVSTPTPIPDPKMPEFEGTVLTDEDINETVLRAEIIEEGGGAQNSTILLVHDFQEVAAVLVDALNASADGEEIPLLFDVFYAYSLSLQETAENLTSPDGLALFSSLDEENKIFGGNLGRIKQVLRDWIVTEYGACDNIQANNVFVGVAPGEIQEVADLTGITSGNLTALLKDIPSSERLTEEVAGAAGNLTVKPTGMSYAAVSVSWWEKLGKALLKELVKALSKSALLVKLANLIIDYGDAIFDCYYNHFPNWAAIENCLVEKHGLDEDVVMRIMEALMDP
jgi:hypothetical protein